MRLASLLVAATFSCASPAAVTGMRTELDELKEKQRIDNEDLGKKLSFEVEQLRAEIAALKESQEQLTAKVDDLDEKPARPSRPRGPDRNTVYAVPIGDSPMKGAEDAWVTIVEIAEYQCPYCARVQPTIDALLKKYGKDLRVVFKHNPLPFHNNAMPAAIASVCAHRQRLFWPMHDQLFKNTRALETDDILGYAKQTGNLNFRKWKRCFDEEETKDRVMEDQKVAANFGARGTPAFFINGRFLSGAQPQINFETLIDEELKKAKQSGIARGDYYEKVVEGKGEKKL